MEVFNERLMLIRVCCGLRMPAEAGTVGHSFGLCYQLYMLSSKGCIQFCPLVQMLSIPITVPINYWNLEYERRVYIVYYAFEIFYFSK
jgi:hypothetical protein